MNGDVNLFTFCQAKCVGNEKNTSYPIEYTVSDLRTAQGLIERDCICGIYRNHYRKGENFLSANCVGGDFDNEHSDDPEDWITPKDVLRTFPGVPVIIHYSRHNGLPKDGRSARPRFHAIMRTDTITDVQEYKALRKRLHDLFPYFDTKAMDDARMFFGTPGGKCEFHPGTVTVNGFFKKLEEEEANDPLEKLQPSFVIREGGRNDTMHRLCVKLLKRLGDTEETHIKYLQFADKCVPPLDDEELDAIWRSALKFYKGTIMKDETYVPPEKYSADPNWEDPIPFSANTVLPFPVDALPPPFADFASAVAVTTQTPVDMAACCMLAIMATALQGKYRICGKPGWTEQLNLYLEVIAKPSERKSSVLSACFRPLNKYEENYNKLHAPEIETSQMAKRILEKRQKVIEEKRAKGEASEEDMLHIAKEIASYREKKPLQLYVDDITTEKLVSVLAENNGKSALISSEGGIFDMLAGTYSKNVNIDVMLKAYSGDSIRVDRVGRDAQSVNDPSLTILLMAQPNVIADVLSNRVFRGRGLVGRFLFSDPVSMVGSRVFDTPDIPDAVSRNYEHFVTDLLDDNTRGELITLSPEASSILSSFAAETERKLDTEYAEMTDWAGKLVGNTLRIAGLICRGSEMRGDELLEIHGPLVVSGDQMRSAVRIAQYFVSHAQSVFNTIPQSSLMNSAEYILKTMISKGYREFNRRDAMRLCRSFKTVDEIQPVLDFLESYGYIAQAEQTIGPMRGRPTLPTYLMHPRINVFFIPSRTHEHTY